VPGAVGVVLVAATLVVATIGGLLLRRRSGRFRPADHEAFTPTPGTDDEPAPTIGARLDPVLAGLGVTTGEPVTLLQFSSAFCAPCRTTRVLCADVAGTVPGVRHLEVDAESHLDAVRALGIWRTPTVLVIDQHGTVVQRATGAPTRAQLLGVVGHLLDPKVADRPAKKPASPEDLRSTRTDLHSAPSLG
jgi:thiol-disulfide isomerase/thioredoxin